MNLKLIPLGMIIIFSMLAPIILNIYGDLIWFSSLNYSSIFLTMFFTSITLGLVFGIAFLAFAFLNIKMAKRAFPKKGQGKSGFLTLLTLLFALIIGLNFSNWEAVLKFLNSTPFNILDPVFGLDIGFYAFQLPFYGFLFNFLLSLMILTIVLTFAVYVICSSPIKKVGDGETPVSYTLDLSGIMEKATPHISALLGILFFVIAFGISLMGYGLLFSQNGIVYGAGYTDLNIILPVLTLLTLVSAILGIVFLLNVKFGKLGIIKLGIIAFIVIAVLGSLASGIVQAFIVAPDEFNAEKPYIERNIENTLLAYNLEGVQENIFPISHNLTMEDIRKNNATIRNIRLWDWRPLQETYKQLQLFRTYYEFSNIDIDRYNLNGQYKQVMLSPRELNTQNLQSGARTWVNEHLVYTHGYGVVMNPVDKVSEEGLPEFYIKDIPPQSPYLDLSRPEIYYGEGTDQYVITRTTTDEFDYPTGEENIYTSYEGTGGIEISDFFTKLVYAFKLGSFELLVSGSIQPGSRLLINRDINTRIGTIAPFLVYDPDPYIVVSEGRLYWIIDAYTTTDRYPYSEPILTTAGQFNYIRNSVKVVVDAYNGDVKYYVIEPNDPVINTYRNIFPELFTDFTEMPGDLQKHIRYPEGLFIIQAEIYSTYHMRDPMVFYNKEDAWVIPEEIYRGKRQEMIPYYVIMKLPGEDMEEFILMIPFTPRGKDNMVAWMAAKSDYPQYGDVIVYQFSKQELTYGPMQIEARVDQDTEISQKITLWSQSGSNVIRGNTLVIPIENSILYIEPLYLEAVERGTLPQLKRVIVAYGNQLTMQESLEEALSVIFEAAPPIVGPDEPEEPRTAEETLSRIAELYEKAQEALKTGDFTLYAEYIDQIGALLGS